MKVYELMDSLAKMPAGAEVEFRALMTLEEFAQCDIADNIDGKDAYLVGGTVGEAVVANGTLVTLYR